jgi:hypothetical protein
MSACGRPVLKALLGKQARKLEVVVKATGIEGRALVCWDRKHACVRQDLKDVAEVLQDVAEIPGSTTRADQGAGCSVRKACLPGCLRRLPSLYRMVHMFFL